MIDGGQLTPKQLVDVALGLAEVEVDAGLELRLAPARQLVDRAVASGDVIYGITTGFGALENTQLDPEQSRVVQYNLIRSHASGVGDPLPADLVRAMLLLRARTLAQGHSGVRPQIVEKIVEMLNRGILPVVPSQGSVGASGDLAPFAHLALPIIGEGEVTVDGKQMPTSESGLEPVSLETKEGLSLLNGTEGMTAMGVLGLHRGRILVSSADAAAALSVEALLGSVTPFREEIHTLRPHPGQQRSAKRIGALLENSPIVASHADFDHAVQDAYSLRCAPQVHGAVGDTLDHMERVLTREMRSVVDNPVVFPESGEVLSGGNFHGQPLAFVLDFAAIAIGELASISERRTDRLLDPVRSQGLPAFLAADPGVNSGLMITQYVQAALVAENRVLSHPASSDSIPTSGSQEDHVSMGWGAGRKLMHILDNVHRVIAIEILCAVQALEYRRPLQPADGTARIAKLVREHVAPLDSDRPLTRDIDAVTELVASGAIADLV